MIRRMVLLRHEMPDGSWHFDWMIERESGLERRLLTFRVMDRVDLGVPVFAAERIGDHRAAYLEFEGDLGGGRGRVERVAAGIVRELAEGPELVRIEGEFAGGVRWWRGTPGDREGWWMFREGA